jgi:hypothetical protein
LGRIQRRKQIERDAEKLMPAGLSSSGSAPGEL